MKPLETEINSSAAKTRREAACATADFFDQRYFAIVYRGVRGFVKDEVLTTSDGGRYRLKRDIVAYEKASLDDFETLAGAPLSEDGTDIFCRLTRAVKTLAP